MGSQQALLAGASIGLAIAAPIGPVAIIVIRRTLAGGFFAGLMTGAGASTIHLLYAALAVLGMDQIEDYAHKNIKIFNVLIACALVVFAVRTMRQRAARTDAGSPSGLSLVRNYASALALCLINPMTFALLLSALAAVAGLSATHSSETPTLAAGVFAGSIAWWICLVGATALIGMRLSPRSMRMLDILAGLVMLALAISTMSRSL